MTQQTTAIQSLIKLLPTDSFKDVAKQYLMSLSLVEFPLDKCLRHGGYYDESEFSINVMSVAEQDEVLNIEFIVYFNEIVASCGCSDDGDHLMESNACELRLCINKQTIQYTLHD